MSESLPELWRRGEVSALPATDLLGSTASVAGFEGAEPSARHLDEFIDLVVERIERRVIDELERRGRRGNAGGF